MHNPTVASFSDVCVSIRRSSQSQYDLIIITVGAASTDRAVT